MRWTPAAKRSVQAAVRAHGLRVICLVCGRESRHYPGTRRLRDTACDNPLCGHKAMRSMYWIARHPELASEAKRRALAVARMRES